MCRSLAIAALGLASAVAISAGTFAPLVRDGRIDPAWELVGLPGDAVPSTRFEPVTQDGRAAVRVSADGSYGNLVQHVALPAGDAELDWRWRIEQANVATDLRRKSRDDAALKLCVAFDLPLAAVPFVERQLLRLARLRSGRELPAATLCYVRDDTLPAGTVLENAYSRRLRWLVLGGTLEARHWRTERRRPGEDFLRAFGDETETVPALTAVAIGADADNTGRAQRRLRCRRAPARRPRPRSGRAAVTRRRRSPSLAQTGPRPVHQGLSSSSQPRAGSSSRAALSRMTSISSMISSWRSACMRRRSWSLRSSRCRTAPSR